MINYASDNVNHRNRPAKGWKDIVAGLFLNDTKAAFREFESHISFPHNRRLPTQMN